jgi:hypothetical protein
MAWGIFSSSGTLSNYFNGSPTNVSIGKNMNWHLAITNEMGSIEYVQVIYRLGNSITDFPNSTAAAATVPTLGNSSIFIPNAQTSILNFTWSIDSRATSSGVVYLNMTINGRPVSSSVGAVGGQKFRFFFELWTFDVVSKSFHYGYKEQNSWIGVPLQVWFNSS